MIEFITIGLLLGLSAGIAPGPLLALVVSETLRRDIRSGVKVAAAPFFTDIPIIILSMLVLAQLSDFQKILGGISILGGAVILYMGYENMNPKALDSSLPASGPGSLAKGILANFFSPHPYLFWLTVGGPLMSKALDRGVAPFFAFVGSFYVMLIGSKILVAILAGRSKSFLSGRVYTYVMRALGLALCLLALILFRDGLKLLGLFRP